MEAQEYLSGVFCIAGRFFTNWATREAIKKKKKGLYYTIKWQWTDSKLIKLIWKNLSNIARLLFVAIHEILIEVAFLVAAISCHRATKPVNHNY